MQHILFVQRHKVKSKHICSDNMRNLQQKTKPAKKHELKFYKTNNQQSRMKAKNLHDNKEYIHTKFLKRD